MQFAVAKQIVRQEPRYNKSTTGIVTELCDWISRQ